MAGLDCGDKCTKVLLFVFNFLFTVAGLALIAIGAYALTMLKDLFSLDENTNLKYVPIFIIVLGVIIFIVAFCGCCGAIQENTCLLKTFAAFLIILLILEIVVCILAFVFKKKVNEQIIVTIKNAISKYSESERSNYHKAIDHIQSTLKCCGATGPADWKTVPKSCCVNPEKCTEKFKEGCANKFVPNTKKEYIAVGIVLLVTVVVEILGVIFGCCLANHIGNAYSKV